MTKDTKESDGVRGLWPHRLASLPTSDSSRQAAEASHKGNLAHRLTHVAVIMGMIAALVGAGHLAAWLGGYLTQRGLSTITMKTNAALCLTLVGMALMLLVPEQVGWVRRWAVRVCALIALLVGLLTFVENLSGWNFGIDQLLAVETPGALAVADPNQMGMPASLSFTLIGLVLLILSRRDHRGARVVQALALAVCLIALLSTIGFLYGAEQFYGIARYTGIAWPTAMALLLMGLGLLFARPAEGLMAQVTVNDPGGVSIRRLLPAFVLLSLLLGWLWLAGERAGVFDAATGTGMMMLLFVIIFSALAYHAGRRASRSAQMLRELNATLESKVTQRTAELQRRARQLQKLTLELSQAEERERRRIAVILHEDLQQQMAGARFHLSLVRNRATEDRQRAEVDRVSDMLTASIEQSRRLSHDLSPAVLHMNDLAEVLNWLANQVRERHGLIAHVDASGEIILQSEPLTMFLFRAAQEILFNVVKHAGVKEATIGIRRIGRYVCLTVVDRGRGFSPRELQETSGIGLFSIRERVESLGGRMKIKSVEGKGSRVRVVVPDGLKATGETMRVEDVSNLRAASSAAFPASRGGVLRVLLVDDHEIVRQGLRALLEESSDILVVGEAADGREAINRTNELRPDVVVMDVSMPLMSGEEATRQIKTHLPEIRVIALSMHHEPDKMDTMYHAGAESYVLKTASAEELLAAIHGKKADS